MSDMTAEKLREIAKALDHLDKLASLVLAPIVRGDGANATEVTVTLHLSMGDERRPIGPDEAKELLDWMAGDALQRDLRRWADEIDNEGDGDG